MYGRSLLVALLLTTTAARADPWPRTDDATGDWGGSRAWLDDHGVHLDVDYTADLFARATGGAEARYRGDLDAILTLDSGKLGLWPGATLFLFGQHQHGERISDTVPELTLLVTNLEAESFTRLSEAWLEQRLGPVRLRLGKQDANRDFGAPRFPGNFMNSSFGAPPSVPLPTFPEPKLGGAAFVEAARWLELRAAAYADDGVMAIGEVMLRHAVGQHALGAWAHTGQDRQGLFGIADFLVRLEGDRSVQLFLRGGWTPGAEETAERYAGGGITAHGFLGGDHTVGIGFGAARFPPGVDEGFLELFVKLRPLEWLSFEPDAQLHFLPSGRSLFVGLRGKIKL